MKRLKRLTDAAVQKLKPDPNGRRREVLDEAGVGLRLVIYPTGQKSWAMRFRRPDGRPCKITLGPVSFAGAETKDEPKIGAPLTLSSARRLATKIQHERKSDIDVVAVHKAAKISARVVAQDRTSTVFDKLASEFFADHVVEKWGTRPRRWRDDARLLGLDYPAEGEPTAIKGSLVDRWRDRPVWEISADDLFSVIDETRRLGTPGLDRRKSGSANGRARAMHTVLSSFFSWLVERRKLTANPVAGLKRPARGVPRDRWLDDAEIKLLWQATDKIGTPFGPLFKLLLLTGCRLREVAHMAWSELAADRAVWTLPGTRTKNHRPLKLSLPPATREVINSLPRIGDYVFSTNGRAPVSGFGRAKGRLDQGLKIPPWTLHDLRRTMASGMARIGIALPVIERCLNHVSGSFGGIVGVYQHHTFEPEMADAWARWSAHVTGLLSDTDAKVVAMKRGRR